MVPLIYIRNRAEKMSLGRLAEYLFEKVLDYCSEWGIAGMVIGPFLVLGAALSLFAFVMWFIIT